MIESLSFFSRSPSLQPITLNDFSPHGNLFQRNLEGMIWIAITVEKLVWMFISKVNLVYLFNKAAKAQILSKEIGSWSIAWIFFTLRIQHRLARCQATEVRSLASYTNYRTIASCFKSPWQPASVAMPVCKQTGEGLSLKSCLWYKGDIWRESVLWELFHFRRKNTLAFVRTFCSQVFLI